MHGMVPRWSATIKNNKVPIDFIVLSVPERVRSYQIYIYPFQFMTTNIISSSADSSSCHMLNNDNDTIAVSHTTLHRHWPRFMSWTSLLYMTSANRTVFASPYPTGAVGTFSIITSRIKTFPIIWLIAFGEYTTNCYDHFLNTVCNIKRCDYWGEKMSAILQTTFSWMEIVVFWLWIHWICSPG